MARTDNPDLIIDNELEAAMQGGQGVDAADT